MIYRTDENIIRKRNVIERYDIVNLKYEISMQNAVSNGVGRGG